jgi:GxxExxY protein
MEDEDRISKIIIGLAIEVHRQLGPGLLESAYRQCLFYELQKHGFSIEMEKSMPVSYKEIKIDQGYRIDLLVEKLIVIEIKAVDALTSVHTAQLLTYLRLGDYRLGLLINFNVTLLKNGIKRIIN